MATAGKPDDKGYIDRKFAVAMAEMHRWFRNTYKGTAAGGPGYRPPMLPLEPAKTKAGGIAAGTSSIPTTSSVTLMVPDGGGPGLVAGSDVDVLNYSTQSTAAGGKLIWLAHFNGRYVLPWRDC